MECKEDLVKISVVVCTYNRAHLLPVCLKSLVNQTLDKRYFEVIIVDNNSTDKTQEVANKFLSTYPNFYTLFEKRQGLSYARNRGYLESKGKFIAYIDDDAKADKDWLKKILYAFENVIPQPSAVGGKILPYYLSEKPDWFLDVYELRTWGDKEGFLQLPRAPYGFSGSNMAFPKTILIKYGGFPVDLGMKGNKMRFGEEAALFYRIYQDSPYFWYDPEIKVEHLVPERNMKLWYRIKRTYKIGISSARIESIKPDYFSVIKNLLSLVFLSISLPFRVKWWEKYWQREFLQYANQIFYPLGRLLETLSIRK